MDSKEKEFWKDLIWGESQHTEFLKKYKDQWVAVKDKKVVAFGDDLSEVERIAKKKTGEEDVPVLFVDCGDCIYGQN